MKSLMMENTNRNNDTATRIARSHGNNSARFCGGVVEMPKNVNRSENREAMKSPHSTKFLNRENTSLYFEEPEATHVPCSSAKVLLFILGIIRFCVSGRMGSTGSGDGEGEGLGCAVSGVLWSGNFLLKIAILFTTPENQYRVLAIFTAIIVTTIYALKTRRR